MQLGFALEMVAGVCVGCALAKYNMTFYHASTSPRIWPYVVGSGLLTGPTLVGGAGLIVEALHRRSPAIWGVGRQIWLTLAVVIVFGVVMNRVYAMLSLFQWFPNLTGVPLVQVWYRYWPQYAPISLAIVITNWVSRRRGDPTPDAREWTGRFSHSHGWSCRLRVASSWRRCRGP
jgi:hypothetical protein